MTEQLSTVAPPLKTVPSHHELFVEQIRATYSMGVVELETTDQESDVECLALSNTLDELASLISIYDLLEEART